MEAALKKFLEEAQIKDGTLQNHWVEYAGVSRYASLATRNSALPVEAELNSADGRCERRGLWNLGSILKLAVC